MKVQEEWALRSAEILQVMLAKLQINRLIELDISKSSTGGDSRASDVRFMEQLAGYTSTDEDSDTYSSEQEESDSKSQIEGLEIYSQNYSHQEGMSSCFFYLPWRPSVKTVKQMKDASTKVLKELSLKHPDVAEKYVWSDVKYSTLGHHLTLLPNHKGKPYQIERLAENVKNSIRGFRFNPKFVSHNPEEVRKTERLNLLTKSQGAFKSRKYISLKVEPRLTVFRSMTTFKIFLGIKIRNDYLPVIHEIQELLQDNLRLLDIKPSYYNNNLLHISLQVGESKNLEHMSDDTFSSLQKQIAEIDTSKEFQNIQIDVDELSMYILGKEKQIIPMKFNID